MRYFKRNGSSHRQSLIKGVVPMNGYIEGKYSELKAPDRLLMGPGPSKVHPKVLRAMATPLLGYMDPAFLCIMDEVMEMLRFTFGTKNQITLPISGTGSAGMEASIASVIEEGDEVLVCVNGYFGQRMCQIANRWGARAIPYEIEWGSAFEASEVSRKLLAHPGAKALALVHAETSTGVLQPLKEIGELCNQYGKLFIVDAVTSLAGCEVAVDACRIDICYSGTQKCIGAPPGLAPITLSPRAVAAIKKRKKPPSSYYLDILLIYKYWSEERIYHHTAPISMVYALREALKMIHEEGLKERFERHAQNSKALLQGLEEMGLELFAHDGYRAPSLNTVRIPQDAGDLEVRKRLLNDFNIEIGGGLGKVAGKIWRIGLMGHSSEMRNVLYLLDSLKKILKK